MRRCLLVGVLSACGRLNFGYPDVACEEVVANASTLWSENDHCYTRHDLATGWIAARNACASLGGHVATISTPAENTLLMGMVPTGPARIGLTNAGGGLTTWGWYTGEPAAYANWDVGAPTVCTGEATTALQTPSGAWSSGCAGDGAPFMCEIEPWLVRSNGHGYRIYWEPTDWYSASDACQAFGAHLATIDSEEERRFVSPLINESTWLGGTVVGGIVNWVTGEPITFTAWGTGQPNIGDGACLAATDTQSWGDDACSSPKRALCERDN